jgi:hypothetical protein
LKKDSSELSATPLLDQENAAKLKWSNKLEETHPRVRVCPLLRLLVYGS